MAGGYIEECICAGRHSREREVNERPGDGGRVQAASPPMSFLKP